MPDTTTDPAAVAELARTAREAADWFRDQSIRLASKMPEIANHADLMARKLDIAIRDTGLEEDDQ